MFFNLETDYAIRIVHCLAKNDKRMDAKSISEDTGVTLRFSLKILRKLVVAEIVKSYKGTKGGYVLARPAPEITLRQVVEVMCGPLIFSSCQNTEFHCTHPMGVCAFKDVFDDISRYMLLKFDQVTFEV